MMRKIRNCIAILMSLVLLLSAYPISYAQGADSTAKQTDSGSELQESGFEAVLPEYSEFPDIVEDSEIKENGYVGRVKTEENDLYTFVFANADGTNTMRVYSHPVKYLADDGSVRDISLDIEAQKDGAFATSDHEIITTFEKKLTDGVSLNYKDVSVKLVPKLGLGALPTAKLSSDAKAVTYAINDTTSFVYELTYAGFKEDIVVERYTGQTEYEFTLYTNGLTLCEEYGSYYLADSEGNVQATIGDIIVFTADERNNTMGSMTYQTVRANHEYVLTIHLDADYLADEDTLYPIRIDPTIEINYDSNGSGAIEDVTINQNVTFSGTSGSLSVGRHPAGSLSRTLMRFPNLSLDGITANRITAASVEIRDIMCQRDENVTVECCIYNNSAPAWSESSSTSWSSVGTAYVGSLLDSHVISYGYGNVAAHRYAFDILTAARAWANGTQSPQKGLVFKAESAFENQTGDDIKTWVKTFASYNRSSNKPSFSLTYQASVSLNDSSISIVEGGTHTLVATTNPAGQSVTWTTSDGTVATVDSSGVVTAIKAGKVTITAAIVDDDGAEHQATCTVYVYVANGVYYVQNKFSNQYLHVEQGKINNCTNVYQFPKSSGSSAMTHQLRQMWKTCYLGNGFYSIRPMHKSDMALNVTENNADIYYIGAEDSLSKVPSYAQWTIEWYSNGYVFKRGGSDDYALQIETASTASSVNIIADDYSSTQTRNRWSLEIISSPPAGVLLYNASTGSVISTSTTTVYLAPEETRSLSSFDLVPVFYSGTTNSQSFNWSRSNTRVTVDRTTGDVTGATPGSVTISGRKTYGGVNHYVTYTVIVTEIANGMYFLKNKQTLDYARVKSGTMTNGQSVVQYDFDGDPSERWIFKLDNLSGYYSIRSENSSLEYYMSVYNYSSALNTPIVIQRATETTLNPGMKWKIETGTDGAYKIIPQTGESLGYVLATSTSAGTNEAELIQGEYIDNDSYRDEWFIIECQYIYNIEHYYDQGYDVRFTDASQRINEYQNICSNILFEIFDIEVHSSVQSYTSCSDTCTGTPTTFNDTITLCPHSSTSHKTRDEIRTDLITQFGSGTDILTRVAWTGHELESRSSNSSSYSHTIVVTIGRVTDNNSINLSDDVIRYEHIYTLLHESSHQLGAPDHYCYDLYSDNCDNPSQDCWRCDRGLAEAPVCLMSSRMNDLENRLNNGNLSTIYCDQCMSSTDPKGILTHLNNHHYE